VRPCCSERAAAAGDQDRALELYLESINVSWELKALLDRYL
jgi:hypothetical protein